MPLSRVIYCHPEMQVYISLVHVHGNAPTTLRTDNYLRTDALAATNERASRQRRCPIMFSSGTRSVIDGANAERQIMAAKCALVTGTGCAYTAWSWIGGGTDALFLDDQLKEMIFCAPAFKLLWKGSPFLDLLKPHG